MGIGEEMEVGMGVGRGEGMGVGMNVGVNGVGVRQVCRWARG